MFCDIIITITRTAGITRAPSNMLNILTVDILNEFSPQTYWRSISCMKGDGHQKIIFF